MGYRIDFPQFFGVSTLQITLFGAVSPEDEAEALDEARRYCGYLPIEKAGVVWVQKND